MSLRKLTAVIYATNYILIICIMYKPKSVLARVYMPELNSDIDKLFGLSVQWQTLHGSRFKLRMPLFELKM